MSGGASSFLALLQSRATENPLHIPATIIFALAIAHTFLAARFTELAHAAHRRHAAGQRATGRPLSPGVLAEVLHLLGRQFFDLGPSLRLKYATLGLLFVNVSIGGTLTHFAAPPVLMVSRAWNWDTPFMFAHFGWRAALSIVVSTAVVGLLFRRELMELSTRAAVTDVELPDEDAAISNRNLEPRTAELRNRELRNLERVLCRRTRLRAASCYAMSFAQDPPGAS